MSTYERLMELRDLIEARDEARAAAEKAQDDLCAFISAFGLQGGVVTLPFRRPGEAAPVAEVDASSHRCDARLMKLAEFRDEPKKPK